MKGLRLFVCHVFMASLVSCLVFQPIHASDVTEQPHMLRSDQQSGSKYGSFIESFIQGWNDLEDKISDQFYSLIDYFQELLHIKPQSVPVFNYDATLVGFVNSADGIGRHPILFKECFGTDIKANFVSTRNISPTVEDAQLGLPRLDPTKPEDIGSVAILTDILADKALNIYQKMPNSYIKVAYTMFESTEIPFNWASILNDNFDMAVVPDPFLIDVYRNCGVQVPLFVLPLPLQLQDFLNMRQRTTARTPFVFGMTGGFWERKNHMRVLDAFAAEFGNSSDYKLILHGRFGEDVVINALRSRIQELALTNVELIVQPYTHSEYLDFFQSIDCYVFLSKGEGFSITPREALACGKPCILTNNTAQISICRSGGVRVVPSNIPVPAYYDAHYPTDSITNYCLDYYLEMINKSISYDNFSAEEIDLLLRSAQLGYQFDCTVSDARLAMRDVVNNYKFYIGKAKKGRNWVKRYLRENLSKKYVSLVKPKCVVLGGENVIGDDFLMTSSPELYAKYKYLLGH